MDLRTERRAHGEERGTTTSRITAAIHKTRKTNSKHHSPTLSFMRFQPKTGRMKERRQAEIQKMAAGVKS